MKTAKIFRNGQSQVVRLPKEFRFKGNEVFIKRVGNAVVLLPKENYWSPLIDSLTMFSKDFMQTRDQPTEQQKRDQINAKVA